MMEQTLFTELRPLYETTKEKPNEIRLRIRMRDLIEPDVLRRAVDLTMQRYPYFLVQLKKKGGEYIFAENHRPVVIRLPARYGIKYGAIQLPYDCLLQAG